MGLASMDEEVLPSAARAHTHNFSYVFHQAFIDNHPKLYKEYAQIWIGIALGFTVPLGVPNFIVYVFGMTSYSPCHTDGLS